ncbi:MAG: type II secretion system minor pseudopilin GspI [Gammaproteobacteria bacterium]|nr:type II secretion system minor pseudopilin GspI [Gammaproteobacteria bacterium]
MNPSSRPGGFTLIEVVVALAIVALGMFAVFKAIGDTAANIGYLRDRSLASWIADNKITEIRLSGEYPSVDKTEGDVDYAGRRWHWIATVSQTPVEGLRRIDMQVRRDGDAEDSALVSLAGFVGATATAAGPSSTPWNRGAPAPDDGEEP